MLLAKLLLTIGLLRSAAADILLLKSQSFNTISQEEITKHDLYNVSAVVKGNSQLDFSLNIHRTNISTLIDRKASVYQSTRSEYFLRSFFTGDGEQVRLSGIVVGDRFFIKDYFTREGGQQDLLQLEILNAGVKHEIKCDQPGASCQISYVLQKRVAQRDGFLFQLQTSNSKGEVSHFLTFFTCLYAKGKVSDVSPLFTTPLATLTHLDGRICFMNHARVFSIERTTTEQGNLTDLFFIRYCSVESTRELGYSNNQIVPVSWSINESTRENNVKVYSPQKYYLTTGGLTMVYSIIKIFFSYPYVVIANKDKIVSTDALAYARYMRAEEWKEKLPRFDILHSSYLDNIFCNFINLNELCCLLVLDKPDLLFNYQTIEFVNHQGSIMTIDIPVQLKSMTSIQDAINTKNYLLLRIEEQIFICKKREKGVQSPEDEKPSVRDFKHCVKLEVGNGTAVKLMRELLLEENYSNCIDGYLLLALDNPATGFQIKPMLITCPYYSIKVDTRVDNSNCDRYLTNCDHTELVLVNPELQAHTEDSKELHTSVYVIDDDFNSILPTSKGRQLTVSNNQELVIKLSDYYLGDTQDIEVNLANTLFSKSSDSFVNPQMKNIYFASFPDFFTYQLENFLHENTLSMQNTAQQWSVIQISSDMSFMLALTYAAKEKGHAAFPVITKTTPNIDLTPSNRSISDPKASNQQLLLRTKEVYLLTKNNVEKDSLYFAYVDSRLKDTIKIEVNRVWGKTKPATDIDSSFELRLQPNEKPFSFRSPLDDHSDLIAVITSRAIYIFEILFETKTSFKLLMEISLSMFNPRGDSQILEVTDILLCNNIMLLDTKVLVQDYMQQRIYLYNIDLHRKYFYNYGFIILDGTAMKDGYMLYYSKAFDKAILVYYHTKTVVEYSLDNIFLNMDKIGNEIEEDTRKTFLNYGSKVVKRFISESPPTQLNRAQKTMKIPFKNHYLIILEVADADNTEGASSCVVLVGKINNLVLSIFKSHEIPAKADDEFLFPQVVAESEVEVIPLIYRPKGTSLLKVIFFYLDQNIELNYKNIFSRPSDSILDSLYLDIQFHDINGIANTDTFSVPRDSKFTIKKLLPQIDSLLLGANLSLEDYGLVSDIALQCGDQTNIIPERVSRNRSRVLVCPQEHYNATLLHAISKECALNIDTSVWSEIKDLVRLANSDELVFAVLEKDQVVIFNSVGNTLKPRMSFNNQGAVSKFNPSTCSLFKSFTEVNGTWIVALFCLSQGLEGPRLLTFTIRDELVRDSKVNGFMNVVLLENQIEKYSVPQRLWKSLQKGPNSMQTINSLLFVKTEVTLFSIGSKTVVDVYLENVDKDPNKPRFVLANSTLQDKYSNFHIEDYGVAPLPLADRQLKAYKIVQLFIEAVTQEMKLVHAFVQYESAGRVMHQPITDLNISQLDPGLEDCKPIHGEVHTGPSMRLDEWTWKQLYSVFLVCDDYVRHIELEDSTTLQESVKVGALLLRAPVKKYNYGGLCESRSSYKFEVSEDYILLNCIPLNSLSPHQYIIGYQIHSRSKRKEQLVINPAFTIPQFLGYTDKNSKQKLIRGVDNITRIIKTSPRSLIEQYRIHGQSRLRFAIDSSIPKERHMHLLLSNNYEAVDIHVDLTDAAWASLRFLFTDDILGSLELLVICTVYIACFVLLYNIRSLLGKSPEPKPMKTRTEESSIPSVPPLTRVAAVPQFDHELSTKGVITEIFG